MSEEKTESILEKIRENVWNLLAIERQRFIDVDKFIDVEDLYDYEGIDLAVIHREGILKSPITKEGLLKFIENIVIVIETENMLLQDVDVSQHIVYQSATPKVRSWKNKEGECEYTIRVGINSTATPTIEEASDKVTENKKETPPRQLDFPP